MDYTGLGRFVSYKLNRPLTEKERVARLRLRHQASVEPKDWLSVIKFNSTYVELVDRWYPVKGWWTWMGIMIAVPSVLAVGSFGLTLLNRGDLADWLFAAFGVPVFGLFGLVALSMMHAEVFRQTHYPVRINRRTRQVYAFRPDGTIIQAPWDRLFLCATRNDLTLWQSSHDVRAHVLADDGETILDSFTLAYSWLGGRDGLVDLWEYIRSYMEEQDGVERNFHATEICVPVDGRREGFVYGLVRTFVPYPKNLAPYANWAVLQLLFSPIWALTTLGRWFAMSTSKVPVWPAEVEAACQVGADDPFQRDWRSNGKYDFYELGWPAICFVIGLAVVVAGLWWLFCVVI